MIEIESLEALGFASELYKLHMQRLQFLLFPPPDLSHLAHFSKSRQNNLGKINIHFDLTSLLKSPHFFKNVNFVLITDYRELLYLPFLSKLYPSIKIIATNLAFQLGRIALEAFHETLTDFDATCQKPSYFEESETLDRYQQTMDTSFQTWRTLYQRQDIQYLLEKIIKINYYQIYNTERGVLVRCLPSGKSNGSCFWQLKNAQTYQKILLVDEIAQFNWKTSMSYSLDRIRQSKEEDPYQLVIFTRKALQDETQDQQSKIVETIRRINSNSQQGISTTVILDDIGLSIDMIPRLKIQPDGKIFSVFLSHQCFHHFHNFVNSYVDYLSPHYKNQIFAQTPDYPLIHYVKLKDKGIISIGSLQQQAVIKKLPLKEVVLQNRPFVRFIRNYQAYLQLQDLAFVSSLTKHNFERITLQNFSDNLRPQFMEAIGKARFVGFRHVKNNIESLEIGKKYRLIDDQKLPIFMTARNFKPQKIQKYIIKDNELYLSSISDDYVKIVKNWPEIVSRNLSSKGFVVKHFDEGGVLTLSSQITLLERRQIRVKSRSISELKNILQTLQSLMKKLVIS